jgi:hypothetical protein
VKPCPCCRRRLPTVPEVCEPCRASITRQLAAIPSLYADAMSRVAADHEALEAGAYDPVSRALPAGPVPAMSTGPRVSGGAVEAPVPIDLDLVDAGPTSNPLAEWAHKWWQSGDPAPTDVVAWLAAHLDRACDQNGDQVVQFAADLNRYTSQLRRAAREDRQLIGYCPTEDCGAELRAATHDTTATCPACGTAWPRKHWLWLADTLRLAA